jgi:hypothetical protein
MMKVIVVFKRLLASGKLHNMASIYSNGVTAGIFLASILLKEMRYLVYIRYLCMRAVLNAIFGWQTTQGKTGFSDVETQYYCL